MNGLKAVYCKEMKKIFKEPKMIFSVFILPVLLMIGIYGLVAVMGENMVKDIETHQSVAVINNLPEEIKAEFSDFIANNDVKLTENGSMIPDDELRTAIRDGQTDLYVSFPKDFMAQTTAGKTPDISMYYNPAEEYSQKASEEFEAVMNETVYNKLLSERLGGSLDVLNVFTMNAGNTDFAIVDEQKASGKALSMFLPYIIVILLFSGTMALGVDAISGEKERGTMASLLLTPASRMSIMMGKLLALTTLSMISAAIYIVALVAAMPVVMGDMMGEGASVSMTPVQIVQIVVIMIVLAAFFVALISLLAVLAKSVKEASSYVSPGYLVVSVAGLMTLFTTGEHEMAEFLVPVYGSALAIGQVFTNELTMVNFGLNVACTVILTLVLARAVAAAFNSEKVMFNA